MKRRGKTAARRLAALGLLLATLPACSPNAPESTREEGTGDVATGGFGAGERALCGGV